MEDALSVWKSVLDFSPPYAALDGIADSLAREALADLRERLNADLDFTAMQRAVLLRKAWPLIRERTRAEIEQGWERCRLEMTRTQ